MCALVPPKSGPKFTPGRLSVRKLGAKNRLSRPEPMHFRETLKTESVILTPPQCSARWRSADSASSVNIGDVSALIALCCVIFQVFIIVLIITTFCNEFTYRNDFVNKMTVADNRNSAGA